MCVWLVELVSDLVIGLCIKKEKRIKKEEKDGDKVMFGWLKQWRMKEGVTAVTVKRFSWVFTFIFIQEKENLRLHADEKVDNVGSS